MSNVSYIRHHDGIGSDMVDSGPASPTSNKSAKLALMEKRQRKEQKKRDEFDTEDGMQAFLLALHNLLIVSSETTRFPTVLINLQLILIFRRVLGCWCWRM